MMMNTFLRFVLRVAHHKVCFMVSSGLNQALFRAKLGPLKITIPALRVIAKKRVQLL